jgi:hypothetical protein
MGVCREAKRLEGLRLRDEAVQDAELAKTQVTPLADTYLQPLHDLNMDLKLYMRTPLLRMLYEDPFSSA